MAAAILALLGFAAQASAAAQPATGPALPLPTAVLPSSAQETALPIAATGVHSLTKDDLRTFLDGLVPYALNRGDIAGATLSVVKDGRLLFAQGYGYADLKTKRPVVPDETLFRPGSISKLFTWTAVMQLVEQGRLDLDKDVNSYLDFRVPEKFGKPITLRNIMTHTAGFEETVSDLFVEKPAQLYPLRDYLVRQMPQRIFPPGKIVAYSNYGASLAGYVVQRVSGEPFDSYIASHIFQPLGMAHSSFAQPLPPALLESMSVGYTQASEGRPIPYELIEPAPAGALASTATDMARFMIAHLHGGAYGGARILKPETVREMHSRNYTPSPALLNGFNLGFYDENRNGHRIIGHAGDTRAFHSDLHLILDADTGMFMSFNSAGKDGAARDVRTAIFRAFLDRYFPYKPPEQKTVADAKQDAARVAGFYVASRRKDSALRFLFQFVQVRVGALADGTIMVDAFKDVSGTPKKWRETGPLAWREVGGQTRLKFVTGDDGNIDYFASDDFPPVELFQRTHGLEQLNLLKLLGAGTIGVCLLTVAVWFGGWATRRRFNRPLKMADREARLRLASRLGAVLYLAVVAGWTALLIVVSSNEALLFGGRLTFWYGLLYVLGVAAILGGIAMVANGALRAVRGPGGWIVRTGDVVLALAGLYGLWAILDYGVANFHFNV